MSWEKPWVKEFDLFLQEINSSLRGNISKPGTVEAPGSSRFEESSYFCYPSFNGVYNDHEITIENSEYPSVRGGLYDAGDNVEYIKIILVKESSHHIYLRKEHLVDKIKKKLRLDYEFETGNAEFDKRYFIYARNESDKNLLLDSAFQRKVINLEPFAALKISEKITVWSQEIRDKEQLHYVKIEPILRQLIDLW